MHTLTSKSNIVFEFIFNSVSEDEEQYHQHLRSLPPKSQQAILSCLTHLEEDIQHVTKEADLLPEAEKCAVKTQEKEKTLPIPRSLIAKCGKCGEEFSSIESSSVHEQSPCQHIPCQKKHNHGTALLNQKFESKEEALSFVRQTLSSSIWYEKQEGEKFTCRAKKCGAKVKIIHEEGYFHVRGCRYHKGHEKDVPLSVPDRRRPSAGGDNEEASHSQKVRTFETTLNKFMENVTAMAINMQDKIEEMKNQKEEKKRPNEVVNKGNSENENKDEDVAKAPDGKSISQLVH